MSDARPSPHATGAGAARLELAAQIHDGPLQLLLAAGQDLDSPDREDQARGRVLLHAAQSELRALLRPGAADGAREDARSTLAGWCAAASARRPFRWSVDVRGATPREEVEQLLVGAARELITNAVRHSRCSTLTVHLSFDAPEGVLEVTDDGIGFAEGTTLGFGLGAMGERLALRGGRLERSTSPGGGCRMRVLVPAG